MFPRISREGVLENERRARIFAAICDRPGATVGDVANAIGLDFKTADHHVRVLAKKHMIEERRIGIRRHLFQNGGTYDRNEQVVLAAQQCELRAEILRILIRQPSVTVGAISRQLNISKSTAHFHVTKLRETGAFEAV